MRKKVTTYEVVSLSFEETAKLLKEALSLDKDYELSMRHSGDILWDNKLTIELTKKTESK